MYVPLTSIDTAHRMCYIAMKQHIESLNVKELGLGTLAINANVT